MVNIGKLIFNAVQKSKPLSITGKPVITKDIFSLKNPYILEALPDKVPFDTFQKLEGKNLKTVCRVLDSPDSANIIQRYANYCNRFKNNGFTDVELSKLYKKAFPNIKIPSDVNCDAIVYLNTLPESVGKNFDAHGLAKISVTDQLKQLNNLLTKGIDKNRDFHTAPLVGNMDIGSAIGIAGGHAYRDGSFIVVGEKGKLIADSGIKHVIVNDAYYNILKELQAKFPQYNFVKAVDAPEYFSKL